MTKKIYIEGMTCNHCAKAVENALKGLHGVMSASVNLAEKYAVVELHHPIEDEKFVAAVDDAGYKVVKIE
ncbi:copper chaperone [Caldicellulosiruptor changbaiensis]|uniref:Copper chaperone CopZ n=1 Tax=Caldicellulosiruptor changbaiensis TaxID=1222016 RepID=A0A3T0D3T4_9FIRM|nr:heavy-metal-associated domain-containing protein [Caldicellulosiruptor changbaiensis]AZT89400.1 copper chaperone [Caldicellulosiruptor changbaiensis]